ncbi:sensor histidine kinase [Aureibacillus halotolerans]|uniref:Histidine kinase n=1 Tax=Aureibacillus halotolerans TaxID=1508390 RepID=A0A4R6TWU3_9BACI|nr:histidine kinase [Aureibacillus halotolerans]TDQ37736.1 histidine kinase [Aureibacillus halotolerans]
MIRGWGLRRKFVTVFLFLVTLPTLLFGSLIYYQATTTFKQQAVENTTRRMETNEKNVTEIISQIEKLSSYMTFNEDFRTFLTSTETELALQHDQEVANIRGYITFQFMSHGYIDSIELRGDQGAVLHMGNPVVSGDESYLDKQAIYANGYPIWSNAYEVDTQWSGEESVISLTRSINDLTDIERSLGMVRIRLNTEELYHRIEVNARRQQGKYFVLSNDGQFVLYPKATQESKAIGEEDIRQFVVTNDSTTMRYRVGKDNFLVVKKPIEATNWVSVVVVNENDVVESLYKVRRSIVNMILLLIALGGIALVGFYHLNIKRITALTEQTKQLEIGDFSAKVHVPSKDEIGELGARFNSLGDRIQQHINNEYKFKIEQRETELKMLQNKLDPHFLYNTLDMIRWTARLEAAEETEQLIERLATMFRMSLNSGKPYVKLHEEISYIESYLELQSKRLGDQLSYRLFVDAQIMETPVMKQILQPLVENAIRHGFEDLPYQGKIQIRCFLQEEDLIIDIIDNGWGFTDDHDVTTGGFALGNLQERLSLAYGEGYGLTILQPATGAWIRLTLGQKPLLTE